MTGRPVMLRSRGLQKGGLDLATEQQQQFVFCMADTISRTTVLHKLLNHLSQMCIVWSL